MTFDDMEKTQMAGPGPEATQVFTPGAGATQVISPGVEATQMAVSITCPVCQSNTPAGEQYCSVCGFLLSSTPVEVAEVPQVQAKLIDAAAGREYFLNPGPNSVGRESADVLLAHPTVSRRHAQITLNGNVCTVSDMGSSNGTYVGTVRVDSGVEVAAKSGDELRFGSAVLKLEIPEVVETEDIQEDLPFDEAPAAEQTPTVSEETEPTLPGFEAEEEVQETPAALAKMISKADGTEYDIKEGQNTIGRRPANKIVISDPFISGSHAVITAEDGSFVITDVGSTNGSTVNGEKLTPNEPRTLADGDEITFGQLALAFKIGQTENE